jgi:cholinesterase
MDRKSSRHTIRFRLSFVRALPYLTNSRYPSPGGFPSPTNFSEDCLTLNVARPVGARNLPVAVWIYGGAFSAGSSSLASYNLSWFVNASTSANKPLIAVSFNYRLSYFGFLAGSDLQAEGNTNVGLYDQRLALRWIKENIAAFGGDPNKITVFGESAYVC